MDAFEILLLFYRQWQLYSFIVKVVAWFYRVYKNLSERIVAIISIHRCSDNDARRDIHTYLCINRDT